jgi:hypothetical protein
MIKCCRPLKVEVFRLADGDFLQEAGWRPAEPSKYQGKHGMVVVEGEPALRGWPTGN